MKKILILANNSGGLYKFRFELIQRLINEGYEVYFSLPETAEDEEVRLIIKAGARHIQTDINRRGVNPFQDLKLINRYKTIIKEIKPDIVLTYTIKPNIYGTYAASKHKIPIIMNITGIGSSFNDYRFKYFVKSLYKFACRRARFVFFQNDSNHSLFADSKLVDGLKTKIIPGSGVNIVRFKPTEKTKEDNITRFIFIGRIMKEKGIEEYLEAAEAMTKKYDDVEFQILGSFEEEKYKGIIMNKNNPKINYLGISSDVRNEIKEVDCVIHPTFYPEGMSNVLLEGAAMAKPLIASRIPGCKEIIDDGINGYLFEPRNVSELESRIEAFLKLSKTQRIEMGENSRAKISGKFDRNIVIEEYMSAIEKLLPDYGRAGNVNE